ncbi:hypothetical protein DU80_20805 [Methanosarcina mazei]|uniref:Uncharacterized protein n=1 Tax=Methanosarcina mazei TaxID=2209 RepID=A0A0F8UZQ4_METMZ|nr:hypothetical protein DU47_07690 [Methanosarcina mazei]KKG09750.1 hypothetical protein DU34_18280 [Methanosarcina mazei]KKG28598.1 hypothetical protein DU49_07610 [Methanosarcina mazei]KKG33848.1 hypothetical protein DU52_11705 [Methanosarcina mazei]KKG37259.1 hypothetical protein DU30_10745 [Methanosarcina mazei]
MIASVNIQNYHGFSFTFILNLFCYPLSTNPFPVTFQNRTSHEWLPILLKNIETDMEAIYLPGELKEKF